MFKLFPALFTALALLCFSNHPTIAASKKALSGPPAQEPLGDPELIHAGKRSGLLLFERVPMIDVDHRGIVGETASVRLARLRQQFEADHAGADRGKELLNGR
ncbi:MAG: hypothetical protein R3D52_08955 [Xanthobacteraceae bacterium]